MEGIRVIVILVFLAIVWSLGTALYQLSRPGGDSKKMVRALSWRVGLSLALFLLLMLACRAGLIEPHGVGR